MAIQTKPQASAKHDAQYASQRDVLVAAPRMNKPDFNSLLHYLKLGWQSQSARRLWLTTCKSLLTMLECLPFSPAAWIATNLDLLHPPVPERDTPRLISLSITNLKIVYQIVSTTASPEWQDYVWDTFTELLERELALEA